MKKLLIVGGVLGIAAGGVQCSDGIGDNQSSKVRLEVTSDASLGRIASADQAIDCGSTCGADYARGATVTLTATPLPGVDTAFLGWDGACTGTDSTCTVTLDQNQAVTANWKQPASPDMATPPDMTTVPAPTVTSVSPASIVNNVSSTLTITGTDFRAGATVTVGGVACNQVTVVSPTQITCTYPGKAATCGGQGITVTEADGQSG
ncbi:MAG TPA: IPT/TIG domain-containing protein, partial [Pseudomonadota bacterium]|nr:IPT/TIG domain-containing protein [Pseudomonadota bacterium]